MNSTRRTKKVTKKHLHLPLAIRPFIRSPHLPRTVSRPNVCLASFPSSLLPKVSVSGQTHDARPPGGGNRGLQSTSKCRRGKLIEGTLLLGTHWQTYTREGREKNEKGRKEEGKERRRSRLCTERRRACRPSFPLSFLSLPRGFLHCSQVYVQKRHTLKGKEKAREKSREREKKRKMPQNRKLRERAQQARQASVRGGDVGCIFRCRTSLQRVIGVWQGPTACGEAKDEEPPAVRGPPPTCSSNSAPTRRSRVSFQTTTCSPRKKAEKEKKTKQAHRKNRKRRKERKKSYRDHRRKEEKERRKETGR